MLHILWQRLSLVPCDDEWHAVSAGYGRGGLPHKLDPMFSTLGSLRSGFQAWTQGAQLAKTDTGIYMSGRHIELCDELT
jgi:hypothetical protein